MSGGLHVAIVAGEESGDLLGADLVRALRRLNPNISLSGLGGKHLQAEGLETLFDPSEIALMGVTAVVLRLPRLLARIDQTAKAIIKSKPDCLVIIDSPDFTHRVAKKVRAATSIPIVNYVCPSVWAWRPGRAVRMSGYVDHVLAILPFEPKALKKLNGPPATFVGHRLVQEPAVREAHRRQADKEPPRGDQPKTLLVLPGSRSYEVKKLLGVFGETVELLSRRGHKLNILMPTVANAVERVREGTANWEVKPEIFEDEERKWRAFGEADAALAASGTVLLELALVGVPAISTYKTDGVMRVFMNMITSWSAALPNLIADRIVIPEYYDLMLRPGILARKLERLIADTHERAAQLEAFAEIAELMETEKPSGELAAEVVLDQVRRKANA